MALYQFKTKPSADGKTLLIGPETEETPCVLCGGEAMKQVCPGEMKYHHHGCCHRNLDGKRGGLDPICDDCYPQVWAEWNGELPTNATYEEVMQHRQERRKAQADA